jgi:hypothetical protein
MKKFLKFVAAFAAGLTLAGAALATTSPNSYYGGFNPQTNGYGLPGVLTAGGSVPTVSAPGSGSTCGSGTISVATGGAFAGQVTTATCTTLVLQISGAIPGLVYSGAPGTNGTGNAYPNQTNSPAPPTGGICIFVDATHPADSYAVGQGTFAFVGSGTSYTGYTCTSASMTITAGDVIQYLVFLY